MAKTKGLKSSLIKNRGPSAPSVNLKSSMKSKSKKTNRKQQTSHPRRTSLRNSSSRVSSAAAGSSSPLHVSSDSDQQTPSSPRDAEPSTAVSVSPPPSPSNLEYSGRFLQGRITIFDSYFSRRPVTLERRVEFAHFTDEFSFIRELFESRGWVHIGDIQGSASIDLVREFYTNFHNLSPESGCFDTLVRGRVIHISADFLASFLRVSRIPNPIFSNIDWTSFPPLHELAGPMRDNPHPWFPGMLFRQSDLTVPFRVLNLICDSLLTPVNRSSEISDEKIKFLHCLTHEVSIDLPSLIVQSLISAHNQRNSRLALPYGVLITNLLRDHFAVVRDLDEPILFQDTPINRTTIRRTVAQKQPLHSASEPSSTAPLSRSGPHSGSDPSSVVVFTLQSFSERLSRLESSNTLLQDSLQARLQKIEDTIQVQFDTLQMHILEPLQAAALSASKVEAQVSNILSSVNGLVDPAQQQLQQVSTQVQSLADDVGDLNRTFGRIEQFCRRGSRPPTH